MPALHWAPHHGDHPDALWRNLSLPGFWAFIAPRTPTIASPGTYSYTIIRASTGRPVHVGTARNEDHAKRQVHGWELHCLDHPDAAPQP